MIIDAKFDMGETLYIPAAGYLQCKVVVIKLSGKNLCYEVEYWASEGVKSATLYEDELCKEDLSKKTVGVNL